MLLLLVRHGVTDTTGKKITGWMPGVSLSPKGLEQAKLAAQRLGDLPIDAVYSSPLERCYETAQEIARKHKLRPRRIADLGEVKYGDWTGRSLKSLYRTKAWKEMRARPSEFRFPGGESVGEAQVRVMKVIETLKRKHVNEVVVACSHADLIRLAVGGHLGAPLDLYHRVSVAPASVTALWLGEFGPSLIRLGDTGSLDEIAAMFDERTSKK